VGILTGTPEHGHLNTGTPDSRPTLQRRSTDENSGIVRNSRIRAVFIASGLIVYEIELSHQADDFREKRDD
jgi:hypothetical protein